jgi:HK97 family phage prohead protease
MNHLDFILDTKAVTEDGLIEGLAAGYGNVDAGGDVIVPGALARSLKGRKSVPMLMYHDQTRPAGVWTDFAESRDGLVVKGQLSLSSQIGQEAHALVRDGAIGGLSIGYKTIREQIVGKTRQLLELALYEVSLVTIPMNERAVITSVKSLVEDGRLPTLPEFEDFLREAGFSKSQATAIAGKGLAPLFRSESGSTPSDFLSALKAQISA